MAASRADTVTVTRPDAATLALVGALTFRTAAAALTAGARALDAGRAERLELGDLVRADSAGLACVLALAAHAERDGRRLRVVHWPEGLRALAAVCDVEKLLDDHAGSGERAAA